VKPSPLRVACLQLTPGNDLDRNLAEISRLIAAAVASGASFVLLPEFATYLDRASHSMRSSAARQEECAPLQQLRRTAAELQIWLLIGSLVILDEGDAEQRMSNRSFLIAPDGNIAASYDKIHLFDATLADGRTVGESRHYRGGDTAVVAETPFGRVGLSVCYDLRFPQLYRAMARAGADILVIPSAFTAETGAAHWETLVRARAIETGCYVLAPATVGTHPGAWETYGHAMIVDPWGRVVANCGTRGSTFCAAEIDLAHCAEARSRITSLNTNPEFSVVESRYSSPLRRARS
jgi:predicted amidohydrolase